MTLAVALGVVTASAATDYGISVNGTAVKSDKLSFSTGGGTVNYNVSSNTLTISAVSFSRSGEALKVSYNTNRSGTLKIVFSGSCQLVSTGNDCLILEDDVDFTVSGATTLGTTSGGKCGVHIKESTTAEFAGSGTLVIAATDGYAVSGDADDEWAFFKIAACDLRGQRGNLVKLGKVRVTPVSTSVERSTIISLLPTKSSSYPHVQSVDAWDLVTNVHVASPAGMTTSSLTYSSNYNKEFVISDERNDPQYTAIGNFQYGTATFNGTNVAVLVKPTVSFKESAPTYIEVPGFVTIGGSLRPVTVNNYAFQYMTTVGTIRYNYGVMLIQSNAMYGCRGLNRIYLPNSLKKFGDYAFSGIGNSSSALSVCWSALDPSAASWASTSFNHSSSSLKFYFPTQGAYYKAYNNTNLKNYVTLSSVHDYVSCSDANSDGYYYVFTKGLYPGEACEMGLVGTDKTSIYLTSANTSAKKDGRTYTCTNIVDEAFSSRTSITSVNINYSGLKEIGSEAFYGCTGLTSLSFTDVGVTRIGQWAFHGCTGLTTLTIPSSLKKIDGGAFYGCTSLTSVTWNALDCEGTTLQVNRPFEGCIAIKTLTFGSSVYGIPALLCMDGFKQVTTFTVPESVTKVGEGAFRNMTALTSVNWNAASCADLADGASWWFQGCTSLTRMSFGNNVLRIPKRICAGVTSLRTLYMMSKVQEIGDEAFYNCNQLTDLELYGDLQKIGTGAFRDCSGLKTISAHILYPQDLTYGDNIFDGVDKLVCNLWVPYGTLSYYKRTYPWSEFYIMHMMGDSPLGDLNGDGLVNTGDVSELYQALLAGSTEGLYDLNFDGSVNTGDVSTLYKIILGS